MKNILTQKYQSLKDLLAYRWAMMRRPDADAAIAEISAQCPKGLPGAILCEGLWDHPHHWLRLAMFRCAAADKFGSDLVGLYEDTSGLEIIKSLRSLGLSAEEVVPSTIADKHYTHADKLLQGIDTPRKMLDLKLPKDFPAHFFYDGILKAEKIGQMDCTSPRLREQLAKLLAYLEFYDGIFERHNIRALVVSHPTTIRFASLVWTAMRKGVPVFVLNYVNKHITIRRMNDGQEFYSGPIDTPTANDLVNLSPTGRAHLINHGERFLVGSLAGTEGQISMVKVFGDGNANFASRQAFCDQIGADPAKPINVIMANCWPDFPNTFGPSYYTDYIEWFQITLAAIRDDETCNWILKPHPAEFHYGNKTTMRKLLDFPLPKGIYLWPESASGIDIKSFADTVITANGTAGFEFPALGIRALIARKTPYTNWGFANYTESKEAYTQALKTITQLPKPDRKAQEDAMIYIGLVNADLPEEEGVQFPWGLFSYRLWPTIPTFIRTNKALINLEIEHISNWIASGAQSYHTSRMLSLASRQQSTH